MCSSFVNQTIPKRFSLSFSQQLKESSANEASGLILDWPRHWRRTRPIDLKEVVRSMNTDEEFSDYYQNTLASIDQSETFAKDFEPGTACPIRSNYEQFSYSRQGNISGYVQAVRNVTPEEAARLRREASKPKRRGKKRRPATGEQGDTQCGVPSENSAAASSDL